MSELKVVKQSDVMWGHWFTEYYLKSEADEVIAEKDAEITELKNRIAPKQSDKTLQERLNEVCEKHGVSTLQDLDWAFCMTESRLEDYSKLSIDKQTALDKMLQYKVLYKELCRDINTQERFFAMEVAHEKYKRCLLRSVIADMNATHFKDLFYGAGSEALADEYNKQITIHYKWQKRWLALAEKFKEAK